MSLSLSLSAEAVSGQLSAGLQGSWGSQAAVGLGGRLLLGLDRLVVGFETVGTFDYFFPGDGPTANVASWEGTVNLVYRPPAGMGRVTPYGGAGLDVAHNSVSVRALGTEFHGAETLNGLNVMGGVLLGESRTTPFLEARVTVGGSEQFLVSAGVRF